MQLYIDIRRHLLHLSPHMKNWTWAFFFFWEVGYNANHLWPQGESFTHCSMSTSVKLSCMVNMNNVSRATIGVRVGSTRHLLNWTLKYENIFSPIYKVLGLCWQQMSNSQSLRQKSVHSTMTNGLCSTPEGWSHDLLGQIAHPLWVTGCGAQQRLQHGGKVWPQKPADEFLEYR